MLSMTAAAPGASLPNAVWQPRTNQSAAHPPARRWTPRPPLPQGSAGPRTAPKGPLASPIWVKTGAPEVRGQPQTSGAAWATQKWTPRPPLPQSSTASRPSKRARQSTPRTADRAVATLATARHAAEPLEELLPRRAVVDSTQQVYQGLAHSLLTNQRVLDSAPVDEAVVVLDRELGVPSLKGGAPQNARHLYNATRSHIALTNTLLRRPHLPLRGYGRNRQREVSNPIAWKPVLLRAHSLLTDMTISAVTTKRIATTAGQLLMFDLCARDGDWVTVRSEDVRSPSSRQNAATGFRTATFSPLEAGLHNKTREANLANAVAQPNRERTWIADLCPLLLKLHSANGLLLGLTRRRWLELCHLSRAVAQLGAAVPRPWHGSAPMDALAETSDRALMECGPWGSPKAVLPYRRPRRYVKQLSPLTLVQRRQRANRSARIMQKNLERAALFRNAHGSSFHDWRRTHPSSLTSGGKRRTSLSPCSARNS